MGSTKNRGKQFEQVIAQAFKCVDGVSIDRLRDAPKKLKGVDNPSDFIVYKYPHEVYVECKSHQGNTLPLSCIRPEQIKGMSEKAKIDGVKAGLIIWFIDHDATVWISIETLCDIIQSKEKSVNYFKVLNRDHIIVHGTKKRIYYEYDMKRFLEDLYEIR